MNFTETCVQGAFVVDIERHTDERGFFARTWCMREAAARGLTAKIAQASVSHNAIRGTLRGMHFQANPHEEAKIVSCTQGAIYDVVLDLRRDSPTFLAWAAEELTAENRRALYVPKGCAHGFQTLADDSQVLYFISDFYTPGHGRGVRYNDPAFGITWPYAAACISDADRAWPLFELADAIACVDD